MMAKTNVLTKFDRETARLFADRVKAVLSPLAQEFGLDVALRGGTYDDLKLLSKVEFTVKTTGNGVSGAEAEFGKYCGWFGLTPDAFGASFSYNGKLYTVAGIAPKRLKRPIIGARVPDGKRFLFEAEVVKRCFVK